MNTAERMEMLELQIEAIYRLHYENFGSVAVPEYKDSELALLWAEWERLSAEVAA